MYCLSARQPGSPLENPRQVSAWRYPRQYGPQAPSFARGMLAAPGSSLPLLLSGTASVVGHATLHGEDTLRQLEETFANLDAGLQSAYTAWTSAPTIGSFHFVADIPALFIIVLITNMPHTP